MHKNRKAHVEKLNKVEKWRILLYMLGILTQPLLPFWRADGKKLGTRVAVTNCMLLNQNGLFGTLPRTSPDERKCSLCTEHTYATHDFLICGDFMPASRCWSSLTVSHVIGDCPLLDTERRRCFSMSSELNLTRVLSNGSFRAYVEGLLKFLAVAHVSYANSPI